MDTLPTDFLALLALVFVWGARHGLDADHLAMIDGLTRFNATTRPELARCCGSLFSLGHGGVVVVVALAVSALAAGWQVPGWLEHTGTWISIGFLTLLGCANLRAVLTTPAGQVVAPAAGPKGRLLARFQCATHPAMVAGVGALFALSFDTMSQAALFALTASRFGGWQHGLALGLSFMAGMLLLDGLNGLWIARLLKRTDRAAAVASRLMGIVIAGIALAVAGFSLAKYVSPALAAWSEGTGLVFGVAVIAVVSGSFALALRLTSALAPAHGSR